MIYDFDAQLKIGKEAEYQLDALFGKWYRIETIPVEIERLIHADRLFIKPSGEQLIVEYKTDFMSHNTGNLIIEITSADTTKTPGWAFTSKADILAWWLVGNEQVLVIPLPDLRACIPIWQGKYKTVTIPNKTYNTIGIAVPIHEVEKISVWHGKL